MATIDAWLPKAYQLDEHALSEIYQTLSPCLYRYAYRLLGNADDAEDLVAETFHRLLLALRHGDGPRQYLSAYLYSIVHNLITDRYRRRSLPDLPFDEALEAGDEDQPEISTAIHLAQERARAALWQLTPDQRLVITLKYFKSQSDEALYPIKLLLEEAQLSLASTPEAQLDDVQMQAALTRLQLRTQDQLREMDRLHVTEAVQALTQARELAQLGQRDPELFRARMRHGQPAGAPPQPQHTPRASATPSPSHTPRPQPTPTPQGQGYGPGPQAQNTPQGSAGPQSQNTQQGSGGSEMLNTPAPGGSGPGPGQGSHDSSGGSDGGGSGTGGSGSSSRPTSGALVKARWASR